MPEPIDFAEERATLARVRAQYLPQDEGKHIVIKGAEVVGLTNTLGEALELGFEKTGGPDFFVRRLSSSPDLLVLPAALLWQPS